MDSREAALGPLPQAARPLFPPVLPRSTVAQAGAVFGSSAVESIDYTGAIIGLIAVGLVLTAAVVYVVTRPSDLK